MQNHLKAQITLRLPSNTYEWLRRQATQNGRTMNGEAAYRLRQLMEREAATQQEVRV